MYFYIRNIVCNLIIVIILIKLAYDSDLNLIVLSLVIIRNYNGIRS